MDTSAALDPTLCYRLPWSLTDNVIGWLEPTKKCNLTCEGCYSRNEPQSARSLDEVRQDLQVMTRHRRVDAISIAGGEPLTHPSVVEITRMVREEFGLKPVINTNGLALTPELLRDLKRAGLHGLTFHVDSSQTRPGWKDATERELNELRLRFARMVASEGGLGCNFNMTVFRHTLGEVASVLDWAAQHMDIVHGVVFILFRTARERQFEYFVEGRQVEPDGLVYLGQDENPEPLRAGDIVDVIRGRDPLYRPAAYLGGTRDPRSFKWTIAARIGRPGTVLGYVGPRFMEATQMVHHAIRGRYLAYSSPGLLRRGRAMALGLWPLDDGLRAVARGLARSPRNALGGRLHVQSVVVIQPVDMLADGEMDMCDGCPDITVHKGRLIWSCRKEELLRHGCFMTAAPKVRTTHGLGDDA